jgi:enoyl-CoA hydratase/carnithine racemase
MQTLTLAHARSVVVVTLNRPEKLNAITTLMLDELDVT